MNENTKLELVKDLIKKPLQELGYELTDIKFEKEEAYLSKKALVIYINKSEGITIEDCVKATKKIKPILDTENPIKEDYIFEVSSTPSN